MGEFGMRSSGAMRGNTDRSEPRSVAWAMGCFHAAARFGMGSLSSWRSRWALGACNAFSGASAAGERAGDGGGIIRIECFAGEEEGVCDRLGEARGCGSLACELIAVGAARERIGAPVGPDGALDSLRE